MSPRIRRREHQSSGRPAGGCGGRDVTLVRGEHVGHRAVVGETGGERVEERGDLVVADRRQRGECPDRVGDGSFGDVVLQLRDVQQVTALGHRDEPVAGSERRRQLVVDRDVAVASDEDHLAGFEPFQRERCAHPVHRRDRRQATYGGDVSETDDRLYFRQLLSGRDFAVGDPLASQMVNFVYAIGDRVHGRRGAGRPGLCGRRPPRRAGGRRHAPHRRVRHALSPGPHRREHDGPHDRGRAGAARARRVPRARPVGRGAVGGPHDRHPRARPRRRTRPATRSASARSRSSSSTRPGTRRGASACSSTDGSSPATPCSSTAAGGPTCPAATRS